MSDRACTLAAVGDLTFGDHPMSVGFGFRSTHRGRPHGPLFAHVRSVLLDADVRFGSLECTLSAEGLDPHDYHSVQMRGEPDDVFDLRDAGFDVVNHATNHSMQHGERPFLATVAALRAANVECCGLADGSPEITRPVRLERNGLRFAFLGYSLRPRQYFTRAPLYAEGRPDRMRQAVAQARPDADIVVVSVHWGEEFVLDPSPEEIALARSLIDAGADLVVGHHPHVFRGIERYGRGWIAYSLGNFVCDMDWEDRLRETAMVLFDCAADGVRGFRVEPVWIGKSYLPAPATGERREKILRRIEEMSSRVEAAAAVSPEAYLATADAVLREHRRASQRHFLRSLPRYPKRLMAQHVLQWARNRWREFRAGER